MIPSFRSCIAAAPYESKRGASTAKWQFSTPVLSGAFSCYFAPMKVFLSVALVAMTACGCALLHSSSEEAPTQAIPSPTNSITDHHGYALLFDLLGDEKNVSKLLIIKRERPELRELIRAISDSAGHAHARLQEFAKADRSLNIKDQGLPAAEIEARKDISKERGKELLTESGKDFELRMLLSQNEALTYGAHLAGVAAKAETNQQRANFARQLSNDLAGFQRRITTMFATNYNWPQK
jgi:hypothetical protein